MRNLESPTPTGDSDVTCGPTAAHRPGAAADRVPRRPPPPARRAGYLVAAAINGVIWYLANIHPTWHAVSVLTANARLVLPWFNLSWLATMAANLVYVAYDPRWLVAAGNVLTTTLGLAALISLLSVFPFDFPAPARTTAAHVLLVLATIGTAIGVLVFLIRLGMILLGTSNTGRR
jgi:hypothetical protein